MVGPSSFLRFGWGWPLRRVSEGRGSVTSLLASPQCVFGVMFAVVAAIVELLIPLGGGLDEVQHASRVDQLSWGEVSPVFVGYSPYYEGTPLAGKDVAAEYGGYVDANLYQLLFDEQTKLHTTSEPYAFPAWEDGELGATRYGSAGRSLEVFSNTVINSPVVYLPAVAGELFARLAVGTTASVVVGMRLGGLLAFWLLVMLAIRLTPRFMGWIVTFVGLLPSTISTVAFVSADTMTIAASLVFLSSWMGLLALEEDPSGESPSTGRQRHRLYAALVAGGLLLGLAKLVYMPLTLLALLVPCLRPGLRGRASMATAVGVPVGAGALCAIHSLTIRGINTGAMFKAGVDPLAQAQWVLGHPASFARSWWMCLGAQPVLQEGELGVFTFVTQRPSGGYAGWALIGCYALLLVVVLAGMRGHGSLVVGWARVTVLLALLGEFLVVSLLICGGLYATFCEVGAATIEGVQARYFIPIVPLLVLALALLVARPAGGRHASALPGNGLAGPTVVLTALMGFEELAFLAQVLSCLY